MTFLESNREFSAPASAAATVQETALQTLQGLTHEEAARRLAQLGPNEIQREAQTPAWITLARQFGSPLVLLLIGGCVVSTALGEVLDAIANWKHRSSERVRRFLPRIQPRGAHDSGPSIHDGAARSCVS